MVDQNTTAFFNRIYNETYKKVFSYVTAKTGNINDIADILQDIYTELYSVLLKKGPSYFINSEAFTMKIAKSKIYKHYSLKEKVKHFIPFPLNTEDGEMDLPDVEEYPVEALDNQILNTMLLDTIADFIKSKPSMTQKVFYLFYYSEFTIPQIAKELSLNQSTVKNKLYRTVKQIREIYGKDGAYYE